MSDHRTPRQLLLIALGSMSLATGVVGIFVPLLPTTCFVLLAGACYAKSSPRLHNWLRRHRLFGPMIRSWEDDRSIPLRAKFTAVGVTVLSCGASAMVVDKDFVQVILACVVLFVSFIMWRIPTKVEAPAAVVAA